MSHPPFRCDDLRGRDLLIVSASARPIAQSARRAGFAPVAIDMFADWDLAVHTPTVRVESYPHDILALARGVPTLPWIYGGGIENYPDLIDEISQKHELLGNAPSVLQRIRDPRQLFSVLSAAGIDVPRFTCDAPPGAPLGAPPGAPRGVVSAVLQGPEPAAVPWLVKPLRSSGGRGVRLWKPLDSRVGIDLDEHGDHGESSQRGTRRDAGRDCYFQELVPGEPRGAVFVAAAGRSRLLGVTRQLVGCSWAGSRDFHYVGSIGPLRLTPIELAWWQRVGDVLSREFELVGLFGVDAIRRGEQLWPIEVNPRITASAELLERAYGWSAIHFHVQACRQGVLPDTPPLAARQFGKAIVCAGVSHRSAVPSFSITPPFFEFARRAQARSLLADIPRPGQRQDAGAPLVTVFADGAETEQVLALLKRRVRQVDRRALDAR